ncbi:Folliculin [Cytospora mali]|uniref:Folliculin n=1 Tax=Cytospora mali TaxID=578113 RepID=A0A194VHK1_CYTMA|nr:Folliculin [Valsa mali var. pyri (nom. inval.)]
MLLIPGVQLCLAHYCDVHGPTPLMVTEGLPVPCSTCYEDASYDANSDRPPSSASTPSSSIHSSAAINEALKRLNVNDKRNRSSEPDGPISRAASRRATQLSSTAALDTPPASPRHPTEASHTGGMHMRRESNYKRTYDETVTKRAGPCDNCALTLPKRQESTSRGGGADAGPTLRTRAPYARVYGNGVPGDASPTNSASTISDDDEQPRRPTHRRTGTLTSTTSRSSASSTSQMSGHTHYLDYTSTHEPVVPSSFSVVRASCIRTLSFETLPRGTATNASNAPLSPTTSGFVTTHSPGAAASGGPIFFGDPSAGYTTAYIFRIPDVHARGHKRVYAFLALSTHRERLAMKTFTFISNAFRELAAWIQGLAEAEAESTASSPLSVGGMYGGGPGMGMAQQPQSQPMENNSNNTTGSGFLSSGMGGLSRRMGGGYAGSGVSLKARGLAELVGMPDFFIELHSRFVQLLFELGVVLSS